MYAIFNHVYRGIQEAKGTGHYGSKRHEIDACYRKSSCQLLSRLETNKPINATLHFSEEANSANVRAT